jgi:hypothetical protein
LSASNFRLGEEQRAVGQALESRRELCASVPMSLFGSPSIRPAGAWFRLASIARAKSDLPECQVGTGLIIARPTIQMHGFLRFGCAVLAQGAPDFIANLQGVFRRCKFMAGRLVIRGLASFRRLRGHRETGDSESSVALICSVAWAVSLQSEQAICIEPSGASLTKNPIGARAARRLPGPAETIVATPFLPHDGHSRSAGVLTMTADMKKDSHADK